MVSLKVDRLIGSAWCHSIEPVCGSSVGTTSDRLLVSMTYDMGAVTVNRHFTWRRYTLGGVHRAGFYQLIPCWLYRRIK